MTELWRRWILGA